MANTMIHFFETYDSPWLTLWLGLAIGLLFGGFAQRTGFCMRSATIEVWRGRPGTRFALWLTALGAAILLTQSSILSGLISTADIRKLHTSGSLAGAIIGGLLFGAGMVMARGCVSRLLVLSATGNLRALLTLLVVAVVVQAALYGGLSSLRVAVIELTPAAPLTNQTSALLPTYLGVSAGVLTLAIALLAWRRYGISFRLGMAAITIGALPALAWLLTSLYATVSFNMAPVEGISLAGPASRLFGQLMSDTTANPGFGGGVVIGVWLGAFLTACIGGQLQWQSFSRESGTLRYLLGAVLLGLGATLVTGCSIGAGLSDGSLLLANAWIAVVCMWLGAGATDWLMDRETTVDACENNRINTAELVGL